MTEKPIETGTLIFDLDTDEGRLAMTKALNADKFSRAFGLIVGHAIGSSDVRVSTH